MNEVKGGGDNCGTLYSVTWPGGINYVRSQDIVAMKKFKDFGAEFTKV